MSVAEIALKYKRSDQTIRKLFQRSKIVRNYTPTQKGPKRRENSLPISRQHHAIGIRLNMARGATGSRAFAEKLGVSPIVLARMEVGQHDFSLSQLITISEVTKQSIDTLMQTFDSNLYGRPNVRN
jgi:hypothetical protein